MVQRRWRVSGIVTARNSYAEPHIHQQGPLDTVRHKPWLLSCHTPRQPLTECRMLPRHNIKIVDLPPRKIASFLCPVKDDVGLKASIFGSICDVVRSVLDRKDSLLRSG